MNNETGKIVAVSALLLLLMSGGGSAVVKASILAVKFTAMSVLSVAGAVMVLCVIGWLSNKWKEQKAEALDVAFV